MNEFLNAIRDAGLSPPDNIEPGKFHRFPGQDKGNSNRAGWCKLFADEQGGIFGDWSTGLEQTWQTQRERNETPEELKARQRKIAEGRRQAENERKQAQEEAASRARRLWREARPADPYHPYLRTKKVQPHHARQIGARLVFPLVDLDGHIHSLQFIDSGCKRMLRGGRKRGRFIPVAGQRGANRILICEGWATGATLAELEPGSLVLAAVDAGNLRPVAVGCRNHWPDATIIVCGDADDAGREKARTAAMAAGALVALPDIDPAIGSDFNDAANAREAVA